jgi:hypothetical protein
MVDSDGRIRVFSIATLLSTAGFLQAKIAKGMFVVRATTACLSWNVSSLSRHKPLLLSFYTPGGSILLRMSIFGYG